MVNMRVKLAALVLSGLTLCGEEANATYTALQKATTMIARGTFDVKVIPQPQDAAAGGPFGRLFLEKQFHGDLLGQSQGQMLGADTAVEQSKAYVALELVTGTLHGKRGSFILQHKGHMQKDAITLLVTVVPDSGTDQLTGIAGTMTIDVRGGAHSYQLEYTLGR